MLSLDILNINIICSCFCFLNVVQFFGDFHLRVKILLLHKEVIATVLAYRENVIGPSIRGISAFLCIFFFRSNNCFILI